MIREIKFRAWDVFRGKYRGGVDNLMLCLNGLKMWQLAIDAPAPIDNQDDFILEQYTGLKDRNGREIYEGDILEWSDGYKREHEERTVVIFEDGCFVSRHKLGCTSWLNPYDSGGATTVHPEVIGNVHENPELLS